MRRAASSAVALGALLVAAAPARAQDDRFFVQEEADRDETAVDGSLTSTTFFYKEAGLNAEPIVDGQGQTRTASPVGRLFTDLRAQLDARHIGGGKLDVHADVRGRYALEQTNPDITPGVAYPDGTVPTQSGRLGGNELELRELYVRRDGAEYDLYVGRKISLELAAVKFDGIEIQRRASEHWTYLGFAGLYPTRGSRDIREDYPTVSVDPSQDPATVGTKRLLPVTGGLGGAYRFDRAYGAIGGVAILPLTRDQSGQIEQPRVFATASGYWRQGQKLDVFHYLVFDAMGAAGAGLTNLTLGVGYQPRQGVRLTAQATEVDTETLNVQVINELEDPDPNDNALQNNLEVQRVAQQSARAGLSVALKQNRFEISTHGTIRRRPELAIATADGADTVVFPAAKAVDVFLGVVDRESWKDLRLGASVIRSFGIGNASLNRSRSTVVRVDARKELGDGKAEVEGDVSFVQAADDNRGVACVPGQIETCYGAAAVTSLALGGVTYYRLAPDWFAVGSVNVGRLSQTTQYDLTTSTALPAITTFNLFLRLAYRF